MLEKISFLSAIFLAVTGLVYEYQCRHDDTQSARPVLLVLMTTIFLFLIIPAIMSLLSDRREVARQVYIIIVCLLLSAFFLANIIKEWRTKNKN